MTTTAARQFGMYRMYDSAGSLLYIGISLSALQRLGQHCDKQWWDEVAQVSIERLPTTERREAARREQAAIVAERPLHNSTGSRVGRALPNDKRSLSPVDVAQLLRKSTATVNRWGAQGMLGEVTMTVGGHRRYLRDAVEAFMATREVTFTTTPKAVA